MSKGALAPNFFGSLNNFFHAEKLVASLVADDTLSSKEYRFALKLIDSDWFGSYEELIFCVRNI